MAFLRPHEEFVLTLLAGLKEKPTVGLLEPGESGVKYLPETMLALGNSGDPRALEPLLELLKSNDYWISGHAANALGYLGNAEAEPKLIGALASDNSWLQVNACDALAKFGSRKARPALEKLAKDDRYTGALGVQRMAKAAIERITKREER